MVPPGPSIPLGREVKEKEGKSDLYFIKNAEFDGELLAFTRHLEGEVVKKKMH